MSDFVEIIKNIINEYGEDFLTNSQKANAILMDLAQDQLRNRLLARNFIEAGGYTSLKKSESTLIIRRLREDFSLEANAASWITHVFAEALGFEVKDLKPWGSAPNPARGLAPLTPSFVEGERDVQLVPSFRHEGEVAIGMGHTVAVLRDGTVSAHGRNDFLQCDVDGWRNVKAIAAGDAHTVGLLADGTILAVGRNDFDQCDVAELSEISAVYAFGDDTICIKMDGTVCARGKSKLDLSHFEQISAIAWHPDGVYGIRQDGFVMMSSSGWDEEDWVLGLYDVVQMISTYVDGSFALTAAGKVYKMGEADNYFAHLRDIAAMVDINDAFAVLREDGKVRVLPYDRKTPRKTTEADNWQDITAIFGKYKRLIGLTEEGRLQAYCTDLDWLRRNSKMYADVSTIGGGGNPGTLDFLNDWYPVGGI